MNRAHAELAGWRRLVQPWSRLVRIAMAVTALAALAAVVAPAAAKSAAAAPDYADPANWLCRPDATADACASSDQDAVILEADGGTRIERFKADANAPIDCFYVYPTVSRDRTGNASMQAKEEEIAVVNQQFARFGAVCRRFAPLYRQVTLAALHANLRGAPIPTDRSIPYADVQRAWAHYLAHDNQGRGVVLIGHSQGAGILTKLMQSEIDGKPVQQRLVSAILAGTRIQVPVGKVVGGDFQTLPLCRAPGQTGCVITFASFRANRPPSAGSTLFGASAGPGLEAACVNPAALGGGAAPLHAYLGEGHEMVTASGARQGPWTNPPQAIRQPFVVVPGLLSAECQRRAGHHYLAVSIHSNPADKRTDQIVGDVIIDGQLLPDWGLHRIDMNLVMGNLLDDVRAQAQAWVNSQKRD